MAKKAKTRARAPAAKKKTRAPAAEQTAKPSDTVRVPAASALKRIIRDVQAVTADQNEVTGRKSAIIRDAVERNHLHKKAFAVVMQGLRMSPGHAAEFLAHFDHYRNVGGLDDHAASQEQMFEERPELTEGDVPDVGVGAPDEEPRATSAAEAERERRSFQSKLREQQGGREHSEVIRDAVEEHEGAHSRH